MASALIRRVRKLGGGSGGAHSDTLHTGENKHGWAEGPAASSVVKSTRARTTVERGGRVTDDAASGQSVFTGIGKTISFHSGSPFGAVAHPGGNADQDFANANNRWQLCDLRSSRFIRLISRPTTVLAGTTYRLQYTTDLTGATGWTDFNAAHTIDGNSGAFQATAYSDIPAAAQIQSVLLKVVVKSSTAGNYAATQTQAEAC